MKFLILDTYHSAFVEGLYHGMPGLVSLEYAEQWRVVMAQCFGTADFYSKNLKALGHDATEVVANCRPLQRRWAKENAPHLVRHSPRGKRAWEMALVEEQIRQQRPDVLFLQDPTYVDGTLLASIRDCVGFVVGQTATAIDWGYPFGVFDLMLSSFPHYVERFRNMDLAAEYFQLGFEPSILEMIPPTPPDLKVVFAGGLSASHQRGGEVLEAVARHLPAGFWGYGREALPEDSPIRPLHHGEVWGIDMYRLLGRARVAINRHGEISGRFANNMRLYEATGVGTCLVTDAKDNLADILVPGKEVVDYCSAEDCVEKVEYLLEHEQERAAIAAAGQRRTLADHTYRHRMTQLVGLMEGLRAGPRQGAQFVLAVGPAGAKEGSAAPRLAELAERAARRAASTMPLPGWAKRGGRRTLALLRVAGRGDIPASEAYREVTPTTSYDLGDYAGWKNAQVAERQDAAYQGLLDDMYAGHPRRDLEVAAEAIRRTGVVDPLLLEVGCGSGYYSEILPFLLGRSIRYVGLDYSLAMVTRARRRYRRRCFVQGDATNLPFGGGSVDIVFNGASLMHIPDYRAALAEASRVAGGWCILHSVPVRCKGPTKLLAKTAYGGRTLEVVFNEEELVGSVSEAHLEVLEVFEGDDYDLTSVIGERTALRTYVCGAARERPSASKTR